jgi:hypothetical protein
VSSNRNELAGSLVNLARLLRDRRNFPAARQALEEALPHHQAALKANPRHPAYREFYRNNLFGLVPTLAGLRDQAGAVQAAERLRDLGWNQATEAYYAACAMALCIPVVNQDESLSPEQRQQQASFYADQAMALLRQAVTQGYVDAGHMKKDTNLEPLRQRADFQKLLAELEAKK